MAHRLRHFDVRVLLAGYTLVEVVVAMLISCVMVTAVMGVAITAKQSSGPKNFRQILANQAIAQLSGQLKGYVTGCGCLCAQNGTCDATKCADPALCAGGKGLNGPNSNNTCNATWYLNGSVGAADPTTGAPQSIMDSQLNAWALASGPHTLSHVVPAIEAPPFSGNISYTVSWPPGSCAGGYPGPTDIPTIAFTAKWNEP
jgi:type II secretory pathway pseudopilin PulG